MEEQPKAFSEMTRGERVIAFIEAFCRVPEGDRVGQPMKLLPFQKKFILEVYDNPDQTKLAILSTGRKNAKSTLIAAISLAHVVGPEAIQNSQICVGARSREQASIIFRAASKMIEQSEILKKMSATTPSTRRIVGIKKNVELRILSAEATTAHGLSPVVAILDEVGQIRGPRDDFVEAISTSQGAYENSILFMISTQAADASDYFSRVLDDAAESQDPQIVCHLYSADEDCDIFDEEAWAKANPAMGEFRSKSDILMQAKKAGRQATEEATFRQLILNQRVEKNNPYISRSIWMDGNEDPLPFEDRDVFYGLDLSASDALTALVGVAYDDETEDETFLDIHATHWISSRDLTERSKRDRVPYDVWRDQGWLSVTNGYSVDYDFVAAELVKRFQREKIVAVAFDRWNFKSFIAAMERQDATEDMIERFVPFGQGYATMSPAIRRLDEFVLNKRFRHGNNPVLNSCVANATVKMDPAGNRKLDKSHKDKRIDGAVALVMAVGVGAMNEYQEFDALAMIA